MNQVNVQQLSNELAFARESGQGIAPLTEKYPNLSIHEAYQVQLETVSKELGLGKIITGKKIGLTSRAMQQLLGVHEPDYGHLFNDMVVENGGSISMDSVLKPKVEAEIAFILKKDLAGPNVTVLDVLRATEYVLPALEIVDSRIANWKIKLPDTIADNASSGLYVLGGRPTRVDQIDLTQIGMVLSKNGELVNTGVGAAVMGHPANCVAWLANKLSSFDIRLKAGEVILSGALSAAVDANRGDSFTARFAHIGQVSVHFN
ncbi:MAG: 2-keto-4-pentenoate hydratase [Paenibacillaceae bacterium]